MNRFLFLLTAAVLSTGGLFAEVTIDNLSSDAEMNNLIDQKLSSSEARIGNNALNGDQEVQISTDNPFTVHDQAQFEWTSGANAVIQLDYNSATNEVVFSVYKPGESLPSETVSYTMLDVTPDTLFIRTRATKAGSSIAVSDLVFLPLDGSTDDVADLDNAVEQAVQAALDAGELATEAEPLNYSLAEGDGSGLDIARIYNSNGFSSFSMYAFLTMTWDPNNVPTGSQLAAQFKLTTTVIPEPSTYMLLGSTLGIVALARKKKQLAKVKI